MTIHSFDSLESTNKYCEALDLNEVGDFTCYWALRQTAGIGQRGNHWHASPGQNLTFSLVLKPTFLPADRQFRLTQTISLALVDMLSAFNLPFSVHIKWPNDVYVGNKKICGTLITTRLHGSHIESAICGVGLNVNEACFPDWVPNPTSLQQLTGKNYDLETLLQHLLQCIERRYAALRRGYDPQSEYLAHLMNLGRAAKYIYQDDEIMAVITGVDDFGRLQLTTADGRRLSCAMKEISYVSYLA